MTTLEKRMAEIAKKFPEIKGNTGDAYFSQQFGQGGYFGDSYRGEITDIDYKECGKYKVAAICRTYEGYADSSDRHPHTSGWIDLLFKEKNGKLNKLQSATKQSYTAFSERWDGSGYRMIGDCETGFPPVCVKIIREKDDKVKVLWYNNGHEKTGNVHEFELMWGEQVKERK